MFFDNYYIILVLPAILLSLYAQFKVQNTFKKYLSISNDRGLTGAQVARKILDSNGLQDIAVEQVDGHLSDHYDPRARTVRLSHEVYSGTSVASIGVAAHETGHALQHNTRYIPLTIRASLFPVANIGSWISVPLIILGFIINFSNLIILGIIIFSLAVAFQLITLPVEFNASRRALAILSNGFLTPNELKDTRKVLNAAALTYVAAATVALAELLRFVLMFISSKSRDD